MGAGCSGTFGPMTAATDAREGRLSRILHRLVTPEAVYGLVLYAAVLAAVSGEADEPDAEDPTLVLNEHVVTLTDSTAILIWVWMTTIVFWAAHVFAHAVAGHGVHDGKEIGLRRATGQAFRHAAGMLYAPLVPSVALLLGAFGVLSDPVAVDSALWITAGLLGLLGFLAFIARGSKIIIAILGGLGTALLGLVMIVLNAVMH